MEISHELGGKLGTAVTDDLSGESELAPDVVTIDLCSSESQEFHIGGEDYDVFGKSVNDDQNGIVSRRWR